MPRPTATSFRLGDKTLAEINELSNLLTEETGTTMSAAAVVRFAVRELHRKKLGKKSRKGIDTGNTSR